MTQRAETTVAELSLTSCVWARFRIGSHPMPAQRHSQPTPTSLVKGVNVFRCNLPPALLAEWPGSLTWRCGHTGVERTLEKSQYTKLTLEKKILPPLLPGFELATLWSRVLRSYQLVIPVPFTRLLTRLTTILLHKVEDQTEPAITRRNVSYSQIECYSFLVWNISLTFVCFRG